VWPRPEADAVTACALETESTLSSAVDTEVANEAEDRSPCELGSQAFPDRDALLPPGRHTRPSARKSS
jgi:hypothetical protein